MTFAVCNNATCVTYAMQEQKANEENLLGDYTEEYTQPIHVL